jgi:hypothetical protein
MKKEHSRRLEHTKCSRTMSVLFSVVRLCEISIIAPTVGVTLNKGSACGHKFWCLQKIICGTI